MRYYYQLACAIALLTCSFCGAVQGQSFGPWGVPSTPAQFFGYGFGPGHHVPMLRMRDCQPLQIQRLTIVPTCHPHCYGGCIARQPASCCPYNTAPQQRFAPLANPSILEPTQPNPPEQTKKPAIDPGPSPPMPSAEAIPAPNNRP